jgi:N-succinyldiaminopimelate aminotransferase
LTADPKALSRYPLTKGELGLRQAIADWLMGRYRLPLESVSSDAQVLPVNGTREALFALAQCLIDPSTGLGRTGFDDPSTGSGRTGFDGRQGPGSPDGPVVVMPNPFYQIYEGAALLAGATPWYLPCTAATGFLPNFQAVPTEIWQRTRLLYLCSPGNPHGACLPLDHWREVLALADRFDFIIAADECYSEIYPEETLPPLGALEAAWTLGRHDFARLVVFHSLSKRSNCPGLRSGSVAGDAAIIKAFLLYRTYHGSAMPPHHQGASIEAWRDEAHVQENRRLYREKFALAAEILGPVLPVPPPQGGFYLWLPVPGGDDRAFTRTLYGEHGVKVLPGSFLAREIQGENPGAGYIRVALVAALADCTVALQRLRAVWPRQHTPEK